MDDPTRARTVPIAGPRFKLPGPLSLINEMMAGRPELLGRQRHGLSCEHLCYFILEQFAPRTTRQPWLPYSSTC